MADKYVLSEADRNAIKAMIAAEAKRVATTVNRPAPEPDLPAAPDVYLAWVPDGGQIPRLSHVGFDSGTGTYGTGTGTYDEDNANEPGSVTLNIFRIREIEGGNQVKLVPHLTREVFNVSRTAILGPKWVVVARDKFGSWIALESVPPTVDTHCPGLDIPGFQEFLDEHGTGTGTPIAIIGLNFNGCFFVVDTMQCADSAGTGTGTDAEGQLIIDGGTL